MTGQFTGNMQNQIAGAEHDPVLRAKKMSMVSAATLYAIVNAGSGGTSKTDDSSFSVASDPGTPAMGIYQSTEDTVDDGDVGVFGMTPNRWMKSSVQSSATIYAVVNTSAAGQSSIVLDTGSNWVGLATVWNANGAAGTEYTEGDTDASITGRAILWEDAGDTLRAVSAANALPVDAAQSGTWNIGTVTSITNDVGLSAGTNYIGLASVNVGGVVEVDATGQGDVPVTLAGETVDVSDNATRDLGKVDIAAFDVALPTGANYIGLASVNVGNTVVVDATGQGDLPITLDSEQVDISDRAARDLGKVDVAAFDVALPAGANYIGLASVNVANTVAVSSTNLDIRDLASGSDSVAAVQSGNWNINTLTSMSSAATLFAVVNTSAPGQASVALDASTEWIGLATVKGLVELETSKTLIHQSIAGNTSGAATIFVPTNTFYITHLTLSANATVGVNIKSGPTYLTGNASISITLFPGGGWVENGQLENPLYDGVADAGSLVIETDGTVDVAGKVVYYEE